MKLAPTAFGEGNRLFTEFKGALTENFVLQTLVTQFEVVPRYWTQTNPPYEVDFLIQRENDIFPAEVKSEAGWWYAEHSAVYGRSDRPVDWFGIKAEKRKRVTSLMVPEMEMLEN